MWGTNRLFKFLMDELPGDGGSSGGGGGDVDLSVDIGAASDAIGADLGLNEGEGTDVLLDGSATPPAKKDDQAKGDPGSAADPAKAAADARAKAVEAQAKAGKVAAAKAELAAKKVDFTGKTDDEILALAQPAQPKTPPKSWKQEMHPHYAKLPPEVQAYIEQREAEVEQGFLAQSDVAKYGKALKDVLSPYEPLFQSQGVDHATGMKFLLNAHYVMSTAEPVKRMQFFAGLAKSYNMDLNEVVKHAATAAAPQDETPAQKEMRERLERLESQTQRDSAARLDALKAEADREVAAFAADPAHPYFSEVQAEVALLLRDPKITLEKAYEMAVYANPVTRAKELSRLQKETDEKARKEAEEAAAAAEKARGTKIKGEEKERASPELLGSMEDTMRETLKSIKSRT